MTLPETDNEFETYLKRRTVLPNGMSDHDKLEPPKALDANVLKEARAAIHPRQRLSRAPRWARPVALAATILLCLSILLNVSLHTNRPTANLRQMTAPTADTAAPTATNPTSEGEHRENAASGTSSAEAILPEAKVVEPRAPRPAVLADANTPAPDDTRRAHGTAVDKATAFANGSGYSPAPTNAGPPIETAEEKAARFADRAGVPVQAAAEPAAAPRAQAPASPSAGAQTVSPPATAFATAPPSTAGPTVPPRSDAALAKRKSDTGERQPLDPKTWLQQIAGLRAAGKTAQADAEMQRFRAAFPTYPAKPDPSSASEAPK